MAAPGDMERLAHELGVSENCHFVGYRDDVGPLYSAFDAVALTSANEGTPVTLIEALAAGVPVMATDVGGVSDVVPEGNGGFLVPAGDLAATADGLARLAADPELRRQFGEAGSAFVRERYSVLRLLYDMDSLYRTLLDRPDVVQKPACPLTPPIPSSLPAKFERGLLPVREVSGSCSARSTSRPRWVRRSRGCRRLPSTWPSAGTG